MEEKELELQRGQGDSKKELLQPQQVKREMSSTRKKLQYLQSDKEASLKKKWEKFVTLFGRKMKEQ